MIDAKLITFLTLCELKSYTKTADLLYVTQPTVTHHINQLEKIYNIHIYSSSDKNFTLTKQGKLLYEYAKNLQAFDLQFEKMIASMKDEKIKLTIAAPKSVFNSYLKKIIPYWLAKNRENNLEFLELPLGEIEMRLEKGEVDFAIMDQNFNRKRFLTRPIFKTKVVVLANLNSEIALHKKIIFANLIPEHVIIDDTEDGKMNYIERQLLLRNHSIKELGHVTVINSFESIFNTISNTDMTYFAYEAEVADKLAKTELTMLDVAEFKEPIEFSLVYSSEHLASNQIEKIALEFEKIHKELNNLKYNSSFK